jgi:hypothetical protein
MSRRLTFVGLLLTNTFIAIIGTAILESAVYRLLPATHTVAAVYVKETLLSFVVACLIGFGMWRTWRNESAKWVWVLTSLWFLVAGVAVTHSSSVFGSLIPTAASGPKEVRSFFSFTVVFVRGGAFSIGAYIPSLMSAPSSRVQVAER